MHVCVFILFILFEYIGITTTSNIWTCSEYWCCYVLASDWIHLTLIYNIPQHTTHPLFHSCKLFASTLQFLTIICHLIRILHYSSVVLLVWKALPGTQKTPWWIFHSRAEHVGSGAVYWSVLQLLLLISEYTGSFWNLVPYEGPRSLLPIPSMYCTVLYCTVLYCTVLYCTGIL